MLHILLRRALPVALAPATALLLIAAAPAQAAQTVTIGNFTFGPEALTVKAGTTVTWINGDDVPHTIVAVDKSFRSRVIDTDERFAFTFTKPGAYAYFCSIHPHMTGKIVVTP
ncbi:MAG: amicyanin [Phenylobacterium sp.]|nr:MAG: amicyanin [Phenylobacterium sp.]